MKATINQNIKKMLAGKPQVTTEDILELLRKKYPGYGDSTLRWFVYDLKNKGVIMHISRGVYSLNKKPDFQPSLTIPLKRLHAFVQQKFPYLTFCVWDTYWFNEFMIHQAFKHYFVIEVEKDAAESVFNRLAEKHKRVFLDPAGDIFDKYISTFDEVIIVKQLVSESPLQKANAYSIPTLEKLLVDCLSGDDLFRAQQNDLRYIFKTASEKYNISLSRITRYARRRNLNKKINDILKQGKQHKTL
jgi:hypothetical protein